MNFYILSIKHQFSIYFFFKFFDMNKEEWIFYHELTRRIINIKQYLRRELSKYINVLHRITENNLKQEWWWQHNGDDVMVRWRRNDVLLWHHYHGFAPSLSSHRTIALYTFLHKRCLQENCVRCEHLSGTQTNAKRYWVVQLFPKRLL